MLNKTKSRGTFFTPPNKRDAIWLDVMQIVSATRIGAVDDIQKKTTCNKQQHCYRKDKNGVLCVDTISDDGAFFLCPSVTSIGTCSVYSMDDDWITQLQ